VVLVFDHPAPAVHAELLDNLKSALPTLRAARDTISDEWVSEDLVYRFWHQSFKVYGLQAYTLRIASELEALAPHGASVHPWFRLIISQGTGKTFNLTHNDDWPTHTRPIVEAFWHAAHMLDLAIESAETLEHAPSLLPSGWATLLELFQIR